ETFWCRLHDQPFRLEQRIAGFQNYWAAMAKPKGVSPKDGAKIAWTMTKGPDDGGSAVHFGVSVSDGSYWRYEFREGRGSGIEPARPDERPAIDDMVAGWKKTGR